MLAPGTVLGRYEILSLLSVGGMAEIYLARAEGIAGFEKRVVLKRMLPHFSGQPSYVEMFLAEARLAATLDHPNIVQVHDIGESTGDYYYAMEYVAGVDLRDIVQTERRIGQLVPIPMVTAIGRGLCAGLDHAHTRCGADGKLLGVVHRDVSLSNVMVSYDGAVKVMDFGVAKVAAHNTQTRAGLLKGKIGYMSPEQCRGGALDRRSDVFAIGIALWELLCGKRLFSGDGEFLILQRIVEGVVTPPSEVRPDVPAMLESIILRALRRDPGDRYQTAREMQRALETFSREERLAISDIELGEYMSELFPPEGRQSTASFELGVGSASSDDDDDLSVDVEIMEGAEAACPAVAVSQNVIVLQQDTIDLRALWRRRPRRVVALAGVVLSMALLLLWIAGGRSKPAAIGSTVAAAPVALPTQAPGAVPTPPDTPARPAAAPAAAAILEPSMAQPREPQPRDPVTVLGPDDGQDAGSEEATRGEQRPHPLMPAPAPGRDRANPRATRGAWSARDAGVVDARPIASDDPQPDARPAVPGVAITAPVASATAAPAPQRVTITPPVAPVPRPRATPTPPAGPGSLDAAPTIGSVSVDGALQASVIRRGAERALTGYRDCYRSAARAASKTPAGTVKITFEIDETGAVRHVRASGAPLPGMAACVQDVTGRIRSRIAPDVGVARASVVVTFAPTKP